MKTLLSLLLVTTLLATTALAGHPKKKAAPEAPMAKIFEISPLSITISIGQSGELHETYNITDSTVVRLEGQPVNARDLRAGMEARVRAGSDHTATEIDAKAPAAHPHRGRVG